MKKDSELVVDRRKEGRKIVVVDRIASRREHCVMVRQSRTSYTTARTQKDIHSRVVVHC